MSVTKNSGEENLRADAKVRAAEHTRPHSPPQESVDVPPGLQKRDDEANLRAEQKTLDGADKPLPTSYRHDVPPGLQSFDDNGQKEGGTKYLGG